MKNLLKLTAVIFLLSVEARAHDDLESMYPREVLETLACKPATSAQIAEVEKGNAKKEAFLAGCASATGNSRWCAQLIRPNPDSISRFRCTYGDSLPHQLIHPDPKTWKNPYEAVKLVQLLETKGVNVCRIYNWWRPEPYNGNVGGARGRHPFGTSIDVEFCKKSDQEKAHKELCKLRKAGRLRALGYYSSTALHFGVGDSSANTWGKSCP